MKKYHVFKINLSILNLVSLLILVFSMVVTLLLFPSFMKEFIMLFDNTKFCILFLPILILYFALHEVLHAIGYIVNGANPKKITFGAEIERSVFYCLCKDEISKKNILWSLMYPLIFIGFVTYIIAIIYNYPMLLLLSIANMSGAAGDIMYFLFIMKLDSEIKYSEMDDGTSFAIISDKDPSKYKHYGLIYSGNVDKISRKDFKRIKISKFSMVILIICIIALIVGLII